MNQNYSLVLASGSPRRRQLLQEAGFQFQVIVPDESVEASVSRDLSPEQFVSEASLKKAMTIADQFHDKIVIGADTIAVRDGEIIGKPRDRRHAETILKKLMERRHEVLTGVSVVNCCNGISITHVETTVLEMQRINAADLDRYLQSDQWQGKAGAFGYQDGLEWVHINEGLASNVVGLPIERLPSLIDSVCG